MMPAVVSKLQLESLSAKRNASELVSQTNSKDRVPAHQPTNRIHGICTRLGISGTIRQKHTIRLEGQHISRSGLRRYYSRRTSFAAYLTPNVLFNAKIGSPHMKARWLILHADLRH